MYQQTPFYGDQIQGQRSYQEDTFEIKDFGEQQLFVLCDGMGGHVAGKQASALATEAFIVSFSKSDQLPISKRLEAGLAAANEIIKIKVSESPELEGMGTTLLAAYLDNESLYWVSVGDSPLWLVRDNKLQRLNADHSLAEVFKKLVKQGQMTAENAAKDPKRHILLSSVSGDDIKHIDLRECPFEMQHGDCLLLASDGVETLSESRLIQLVSANPKATLCVSQILEAVKANNKPQQDNASVIVYQHVGTSKSIAGSRLLTSKPLIMFLVTVCLIAIGLSVTN